jgi:hypothetical protein
VKTIGGPREERLEIPSPAAGPGRVFFLRVRPLLHLHPDDEAGYLDTVVRDHITGRLAGPQLIRAEISKRLDAARTSDPVTKQRHRPELALANAASSITALALGAGGRWTPAAPALLAARSRPAQLPRAEWGHPPREPEELQRKRQGRRSSRAARLPAASV